MNKNIKKMLSVILSVLLIAAAVPTVFAADGFQGQGTQAEPYLIADAADMALFSARLAGGETFSGKHFALAADIDLGDSYVPAGTEDSPFEGTFDGAGHTFSGYYTIADKAGIFACIRNAVVRNVKVSGYILQGEYAAGAIAANAVDSVISGCTAENCTFYCYSGACGGIVGNAEGGRISGCKSSSVINSFTEFAGGIAGSASAEIADCENSGAVDGYKNVGGIVGSASGLVSGCRNLGEVTVSGEGAGGIAGTVTGSIAACLNKGSVSAANSDCGRIGGIAGTVRNASVRESSNEGSVTAKDDFCAGVAAYVYGGTLSDCFNAGAVSSTGDYAAGVFGYLGNNSAASVKNCYNAGALYGAADCVAGIGGIAVAGTVTDCITANAELTVVEDVTKAELSGCKAVDASALKTAGTFSGWDFDNVWEINGYHSYAYPVLRAVEYHDLSFLRVVEPTCKNGGYSEYFCSVCMASYKYEPTAALGHDFVTVSSTAATCTEAGYADLKCSRCTETKSETYPAAGHVDNNNDLRCDVCGTLFRDNGGSTGEKSFFEKVADFFARIFEWIRNLFKR